MSDDLNPKPLSVPKFESTLPPEFLKDLDDRGKYMYQGLDEMRQGLQWLTQRAVADASTLDEVKQQTQRTNGRLLVAEQNIKDIKTAQATNQPAIETVNVMVKMAKNKFVWVAAAAFLLLGLPAIVNHAPTPGQFVSLVAKAFGN